MRRTLNAATIIGAVVIVVVAAAAIWLHTTSGHVQAQRIVPLSDLEICRGVAAEWDDMPPDVLKLLSAVDPDDLSDWDRWQWRETLEGLDDSGDQTLFYSCQDFWSEPARQEHDLKRNNSMAFSCMASVGIVGPPELARNPNLRNKPVWDYYSTISLDIGRQMVRPYSELTTTDRMVLALYMDSWECELFYPQLFTGHWIPTFTGGARPLQAD